LRAGLLHSSRITRHEFCNAYQLLNQSLVFVVLFGFKPIPDSIAKQGKGVEGDVSRFDKDAQGAEVRRNYEDLDW
jgi:hypothetical protein